jgi:hypothetical protein
MPSFLPYGKAGGRQIPRWQGFAVACYGYTLAASDVLRLLQRWGEHAITIAIVQINLTTFNLLLIRKIDIERGIGHAPDILL